MELPPELNGNGLGLRGRIRHEDNTAALITVMVNHPQADRPQYGAGVRDYG